MTQYDNLPQALSNIQLAIECLSDAASNLREVEDGKALNGEVAYMIGGIQDVLSNLQGLVSKESTA